MHAISKVAISVWSANSCPLETQNWVIEVLNNHVCVKRRQLFTKTRHSKSDLFLFPLFFSFNLFLSFSFWFFYNRHLPLKQWSPAQIRVTKIRQYTFVDTSSSVAVQHVSKYFVLCSFTCFSFFTMSCRWDWHERKRRNELINRSTQSAQQFVVNKVNKVVPGPSRMSSSQNVISLCF